MSCNCFDNSAQAGTNKFFSKFSKKYLKQFRKRGLAKEQRYLAEGIALYPIKGTSLLEIGCGVGGLHLTLLKQGAVSATGIDISEGMLQGAKQLAQEMGFDKQTTYILGDFVQTNSEISEADITILDKVVCCYENVDELLETSLAKTRKIYALSFPRPTLFIKTMFHVPIVLGKLLKWSFHPYWHEWHQILQTIEQNGFTQTFHKHTFVWDVRVFEKQ